MNDSKRKSRAARENRAILWKDKVLSGIDVMNVGKTIRNNAKPYKIQEGL